jgi:hypothetical protein
MIAHRPGFVALYYPCSDDMLKPVNHSPPIKRLSKRPCSRSSRAISRTWARSPPLSGLRATRALPSAVFGPVLCSHGRHRLIASA